MSCRRAPEMAAGDFAELVTTLLGFASNSILCELAALRIEEVDKALIMRAFNSARTHIFFYIELKLGCWNQNPWGLFALGHHDLDTVRLCMKACLEFYQVETLDKGGASSSQLEFLLCHPGTVGY